MLLKKIILDNFQSHKHTEIEVAPTLTVIVGESDNGKSAVARALKWIFYNEPRGSDFIRAGEERCSVTLIYDDGTSIQRTKNVSGSKNRYIMSKPGEEDIVLEGFGTNVPKEITDFTGIKKIKIDDTNELDLYISNQLDAPFMLSESGAVKAKAIGNLTGNYIFDYAHKKAVLDINRSKEEQKRVAKDIEDLDENLKDYAALPQLENKIEKLEKIFKELTQITDTLNKLDYIAAKLKSCISEIAKLTELYVSLDNIGVLENYVLNAEILFNQYANIQKINRGIKENDYKLRSADGIIDKTKNIEELEAVTGNAQKIVSDMENTFKLSSGYKKIAKNLKISENVIDKLDEITHIDADIKNAADIYERYSAIVDIYKKYRINNNKLTNIEYFMVKTENLPYIDKNINAFIELSGRYAVLLSLTAKLKKVDQNIILLENDIKKYENYINAHIRKYEEILKRLKVCPVCNSVITGEMAHEIALSMRKY